MYPALDIEGFEASIAPYGGAFVAETLFEPLAELEHALNHYLNDEAFMVELEDWMRNFVGRPNPIYFAERYSEYLGGARVLLKREDLNHTGSHKINNTMGQGLLAKKMGKKRVIAETGAGQHGVATATVASVLGLSCTVYMGEKDMARQRLNVYRMQQLGAEVIPVNSGSATLKDALNEALREWVNRVDDTFYIIGTVVGPRPYPAMVRYFQSIIGLEVRQQMRQQYDTLPDALVACVGGGSNAIGLFAPFLEDETVAMYGIEAGGLDSQQNSAPLKYGKSGILHGNRTYILMDEDGQISPTHSISAGLDYPGVGPEHSALKDSGRVRYIDINDQSALASFHRLAHMEGIVPALETSHALAYTEKLAPKMTQDQWIVVALSGRGDKDVQTVTHLEDSSKSIDE